MFSWWLVHYMYTFSKNYIFSTSMTCDFLVLCEDRLLSVGTTGTTVSETRPSKASFWFDCLLCLLVFGVLNGRSMDQRGKALPGVLGNRGIRPFISGEQGNKSLKLKGTGEQRQFWGTGNIENQDLILGNKGKCRFFFQGNKGTGTPPPPRFWEGLRG